MLPNADPPFEKEKIVQKFCGFCLVSLSKELYYSSTVSEIETVT